jgi:bifunctional UDP-N-acetylglucosamine pyrophosphorylase/glucosamine-1-phosphate N-acetyltransferase
MINAALHVAEPDQIVAVVGYQAELVRQSVTAPVRFAEQSDPKGTGHAVMCAREAAEAAGGQLLILNGDGPLLRPATLQALIDSQRRDGWAGSLVTTEVNDPTGYGRIVRNGEGLITSIVEEKAATPEIQKIREINTGFYYFDAPLFWKYIDEVKPDNPAHEYYLTDMIEILVRRGYHIAPFIVKDSNEVLGINTRAELAVADRILRNRKTHELMLSGVTIENPDTVTIDARVEVGPDSIIEANVHLRGRTRIGSNCRIGMGSVLRSCEVEDDVTIRPYVVAEASRLGTKSFIGPFSHLRLETNAGAGTHIGNFVELKKTTLGNGSKANHLAYLGDSTIGAGVNIGAGSITCNYDGQAKNPTVIGDNVFVGSNSTLIAPLTIYEGAYIAAGSVITKNVEADSLAIGRSRQTEKPGWAKRRRTKSEAVKSS